MEIIKYPHSTCTSIVHYMDIGFGPFNDGNSTIYETLPTCTLDGFMYEERGAKHENMVNHLKAESEFVYSPLHQMMLPAPIAGWPNRITIPAYLAGKIGTRSINLGLCSGSLATQYLPTNSWSKVYHYGVYQNSRGFWNIDQIISSTKPGLAQSCTRYEIVSMANINPDQVNVSVQVQYGASAFQTGLNLFAPLSVEQIKNSMAGIGTHGGYSASGSKFRYRVAQDTWLNPVQLQQLCRRFYQSADMGASKLPEKHFGDLAGVAAQSLNASKVNMLEFLRDMRHPEHMIPKLRNLAALKKFSRASKRKKLKELSDDYLCVHYGIMPTISDINGILAAFKKKPPHHDLMGRTIANASHHASFEEDNVSYSLEQHVKLCLSDEDSALNSLIRDLDSYGFLPTFKRLWDLVPFSFVIDWLVQIGDLLDRADKIGRLLKLDIHYCVLSQKRIVTSRLQASPSLPISGQFSWSHYHRWVQVRAPLPPLSLQASSTASDHWLEATALILQRDKSSR